MLTNSKMKIAILLSLFSTIGFCASVSVKQFVTPVLKGKPSIALQISIKAKAGEKLSKIVVSNAGTQKKSDISSVQIIQSDIALGEYPGIMYRDGKFNFSAGEEKSEGKPYGKKTTFHKTKGFAVISSDYTLKAGENHFFVFYEINPKASLLRKVDCSLLAITVNGKKVVPTKRTTSVKKRIGVALRDCGWDGSKYYRIPGMVTTNKGTLISVYDIRYNHSGDLCAKVDVGASRSTNGGSTWEKMQIAMTRKGWKGVSHTNNGVGDPAILVDRKTNTIWVMALWAHKLSGRMWTASKKGMEPEETGQLLLVKSTDDGKTWSQPINITKQVKDPSMTLILQGPGMGITLKDGTLVFPIQYQDGNKNRDPYASIVYSKDRGKTWKIGTPVYASTTESQVVQLTDGSIMLNSRKKSGGGRIVCITKDLGKTWTKHSTDNDGSIFPISGCMSSLIRGTEKRRGWDKDRLVFAGPHDSGKSRRSHMAVKISEDEGKSWCDPLLIDQVTGAYSCLSMVGGRYVGLLYEAGRHTQLVYVMMTMDEIMGKKIRPPSRK